MVGGKTINMFKLIFQMICGTSLDCPGYDRHLDYIYRSSNHFTTYVNVTRAELGNDKQADNFNLSLSMLNRMFVEQ